MDRKRIFFALVVVMGLGVMWSCKHSEQSIDPEYQTDIDARTSANDTTSTPQKPSGYRTVSLAEEKFEIEAFSPDTLLTFGVFLRISSVEKIGCSDSYLSLQNEGNETLPYQLIINDLSLNRECDQTAKKITATYLIETRSEERLFRIRIGEKILDGKITRNQDHFLFEWPDDSQIVFTNKILYF